MNPGFILQVNEDGWEDVTAVPDIDISVSEGDAVHQTSEYNFLGLIRVNVTDSAGSDHIQIEIVKEPTGLEVQRIIQLINNHSAETGASVAENPDMVNMIRSYVWQDQGDRRNAPEAFNNFMSLASSRMDDPESPEPFNAVVTFENDESDLSEENIAYLDNFFSNPMILLDNAGRDVTVNLDGYASASGSRRHNRRLVERRINSVSDYILDRIINSQINVGVFDYTPHSENYNNDAAIRELESNPETYDPAAFRVVNITVIRQGRGGQNVFAHELGHVFGLGDEYVGRDQAAGDEATHSQLAISAGVESGSQLGNDDRLMSTGNRVTAAHYSTFADALNQLTSKNWKVVTI
jgi:outer membrane protein OmpA-like peptidoglycan-associated protein